MHESLKSKDNKEEFEHSFKVRRKYTGSLVPILSPRTQEPKKLVDPCSIPDYDFIRSRVNWISTPVETFPKTLRVNGRPSSISKKETPTYGKDPKRVLYLCPYEGDSGSLCRDRVKKEEVEKEYLGFP